MCVCTSAAGWRLYALSSGRHRWKKWQKTLTSSSLASSSDTSYRSTSVKMWTDEFTPFLKPFRLPLSRSRPTSLTMRSSDGAAAAPSSFSGRYTKNSRSTMHTTSRPGFLEKKSSSSRSWRRRRM
ncbi:unnamed protein product [Ixodes persulcatus]